MQDIQKDRYKIVKALSLAHSSGVRWSLIAMSEIPIKSQEGDYMEWYVLHVSSGQELQVRYNLLRETFTASVPREMRWIHCNGGWLQREYLIFPGYVFVQTEMNAQRFHYLKSMESVIRILGANHHPESLPFLEAQYIEWLDNGGQVIQPTVIKRGQPSQGFEAKPIKGILDNEMVRIVRYDWHRRKAEIKLPFLGKNRTLQLSITPYEFS